MAKAEWGIKRSCQSCGARFYDLQRSPITCPKCQNVYELTVSRGKRSKVIADDKVILDPMDESLLVSGLDLPDALDDGIGDDVLMEDTDELDETIESVSGVIDHDENPEEV